MNGNWSYVRSSAEGEWFHEWRCSQAMEAILGMATYPYESKDQMG